MLIPTWAADWMKRQLCSMIHKAGKKYRAGGSWWHNTEVRICVLGGSVS